MDASRQETCAVTDCYSSDGRRDRGWSAFAVVRAQAHAVLPKHTWFSAHVYCTKLSNCLHLYYRSAGSTTTCAAALSGSSLQDNVQSNLLDAKCRPICIDKCLVEIWKHFSCDAYGAGHNYIGKHSSSWKDQLEDLRLLTCNLLSELHNNCTLAFSQVLLAASWENSRLIARAYSS